MEEPTPPQVDPASEQSYSKRALTLFWVSVGTWVFFISWTALTSPRIQAFPALSVGFPMVLVLPLVSLAGVNAAVFYGYEHRDIRANALVKIAWIVSILVAVPLDLAFLLVLGEAWLTG